jgi:hypothetical protein
VVVFAGQSVGVPDGWVPDSVVVPDGWAPDSVVVPDGWAPDSVVDYGRSTVAGRRF